MDGERKCLECGLPISGRNDKKFCDDVCRSAYNNKQNRSTTNLVRNVNRALSKNRKILADLNPAGKAKVRREQLNARGFDFNYYTNIYETQKGGRYFFCYDQGYIELPNDELALVVKKEYVTHGRRG